MCGAVYTLLTTCVPDAYTNMSYEHLCLCAYIPCTVNRVCIRPVLERLLSVEEDELQSGLRYIIVIFQPVFESLLPEIEQWVQGFRQVEHERARRRGIGRAYKLA